VNAPQKAGRDQTPKNINPGSQEDELMHVKDEDLDPWISELDSRRIAHSAPSANYSKHRGEIFRHSAFVGDGRRTRPQYPLYYIDI
jgi:hypothetical protein